MRKGEGRRSRGKERKLPRSTTLLSPDVRGGQEGTDKPDRQRGVFGGGGAEERRGGEWKKNTKIYFLDSDPPILIHVYLYSSS